MIYIINISGKIQKKKKLHLKIKIIFYVKFPSKKNILEYLFKIHKENNHRCGELLKRNIYYFGIIKDIKKIVLFVV